MKTPITPPAPSPDPLENRCESASFTWPRLFVPSMLAPNVLLELPQDQAHYLRVVLRQKGGAPIRVFNGKDGDWQARLQENGKKGVFLRIESLLRPQTDEPDIWLCCAPIKKHAFDLLLTKSTELGVAAFKPILTDRTQGKDVNLSRAKLILNEAAEQSERCTIPDFSPPISFHQMLTNWPPDRPALFCAESGKAAPINEILTKHRLTYCNKCAIFTGPEGGFTAQELEQMASHPLFTPVRLGPRILRAETAAMAALACWQSVCGDWRV